MAVARRYCAVPVRRVCFGHPSPMDLLSRGSRNPRRACGSRILSLPVSFLRRAPWYVVPLAIFLLTRLVDGVLILLAARHQIPASALAPDLPLPTLVDPHSYFHVIANWDGQWYRADREPRLPLDAPDAGRRGAAERVGVLPGVPAAGARSSW